MYTLHSLSACNMETSFHSCVLHKWKEVLLCTYLVLGFLVFLHTHSRLRMGDLAGAEI